MNQPSWLKDAVFYNIYPQSFYDTNGDGIGDLPGITQKLPYLHDMGFNAVWLNPFYVSPFRDAGYDIADFYKVAPRYGTNEDFAALCRAAHEQGIRVVVDLVAGHTALECEWFQKSAQPEKNELSNRYIWTDDWQKDYHGMGVGGLASRNGMFLRNFFYCQPALNYGFKQIDDPAWQLPMDHPDCRATKQALLDIMEFWLALGADGFRVDMASSLIKNDPDGSGIRAFWQEIRRMFNEKHPDCVLISEWSYPERAIAAGFHIDFMIHFNLAGYTSLFRAENRPQECNCFPGSSFFQKDGNGCIENFLPRPTVRAIFRCPPATTICRALPTTARCRRWRTALCFCLPCPACRSCITATRSGCRISRSCRPRRAASAAPARARPCSGRMAKTQASPRQTRTRCICRSMSTA